MGICMLWWRRVGGNVVVTFSGGDEDCRERENEATVRWYARKACYLRPVMMFD